MFQTREQIKFLHLWLDWTERELQWSADLWLPQSHAKNLKFGSYLQMLLDCCNMTANKAACQSLMATYPELQDADLNTNPNYCYIPGNLCSLYGCHHVF